MQLQNDFGPKRPPVAAMQTWPEKIALQLLSSVEELRSSKTKNSYLNNIAFTFFTFIVVEMNFRHLLKNYKCNSDLEQVCSKGQLISE